MSQTYQTSKRVNKTDESVPLKENLGRIVAWYVGGTVASL